MNTFIFDYEKYITIQNVQKDLIFQRLFYSIKEPINKGKFCSFCNGIETEYISEKKFLDYPKWLIIIIEPNQVNYFNIGLNMIFTNGRTVHYELSYFIEANTNLLYCINNRDKYFCNKKIGINILGENEQLAEKKPIVLFYKLIAYNHVMSLENNIQPIQNQNNQNLMNQNNIPNMNSFNQNFQQREQQNFFLQNQNNFQNDFSQPQINLFQQNFNQQNMITQTINPQNININGMNSQTLNPQNIQNMNEQGFNNQNNFQNFNINNSINNIVQNNNLINNFQNNINNNFQNNQNNNMMSNNINNQMSMDINRNDLNMNQFINKFNNIDMNNFNNMIMPNQMNFMNNMNNNFGMNNMNMNMINNMNIQNAPQLVDFNQIMVIQFISSDQKINRGIKCLPSDLFFNVEMELYKIYPEYRETNNNFLANGNIVIKTKTIAENNIKDGQVVELIKLD